MKSCQTAQAIEARESQTRISLHIRSCSKQLGKLRSQQRKRRIQSRCRYAGTARWPKRRQSKSGEAFCQKEVRYCAKSCREALVYAKRDLKGMTVPPRSSCFNFGVARSARSMTSDSKIRTTLFANDMRFRSGFERRSAILRVG